MILAQAFSPGNTGWPRSPLPKMSDSSLPQPHTLTCLANAPRGKFIGSRDNHRMFSLPLNMQPKLRPKIGTSGLQQPPCKLESYGWSVISSN